MRHKVLSIIQARQEGKCYHCGKLIHDNESIVIAAVVRVTITKAVLKD